MSRKLTLVLILMLSACEVNHEHDGLYVANKQISGITRAWILEGDELTIYTAGEIDVKRVDIYKDKIVTSDDATYTFNQAGDLIVPARPGTTVSVTMKKFSKRTKYNFGELEKIIDDAIPVDFKR